MRIEKTSLNYVYSKDSDVAKYIEFLIDRIRKVEYLDFNPICIEEQKISKAKFTKLESELQDLTKTTRTNSKDYVRAGDIRQTLERHKIAKKYSELSPALILNYGQEDELTILGKKKSLSIMLDAVLKAYDASKFIGALDLSGFENTVKEIFKLVGSAIETERTSVGEGLKTTQ